MLSKLELADYAWFVTWKVHLILFICVFDTGTIDFHDQAWLRLLEAVRCKLQVKTVAVSWGFTLTDDRLREIVTHKGSTVCIDFLTLILPPSV